jgi:hypothetical protein
MSNIDTVINFIKLQPDFDKNEMIEQIMITLKVTRSNAQVYIYNAQRKMGNAPVKAAKVKTEVKATKKEKYLPGQTSSEKKSKTKVDRNEVLKEMDRINAELDEFERTHEKHPNGILWVKKKNLETMKAVSRRLAKERREQEERDNEVNNYMHGSSEQLTRNDLRELGL